MNRVTSSILQYNPKLNWLFDKSKPFNGEVKKFDNKEITLADLTNGVHLENGNRASACTSISASWVCHINDHPWPGTYGGVKCTGMWVIRVSIIPCPLDGGGTGTFDPGDDDDPSGGGGGGGSGPTQTVVLEICDGYTLPGEGDSEDCEDDYAAYFIPFICEDYVNVAEINAWASNPSNRAAATDLANFLANNYPENNPVNCAEVEFEDPLENYDFTEESPEILIFEQDYRNDMSQAELAIFDNLNRWEQLDYLHSAFLAQEYAKLYFENIPMVQYNGKGDAYRHGLWNAIGAAKLGVALMKQLTDAHEEQPFNYPYEYKEKQMDLFNNQVGLDIGSQSSFFLMMKVKLAVDRGDLRYLSNTLPKATASSQLIPTNE